MSFITKHFLSLAILAISFSIAAAAFGNYRQHQLQSRIVGGSAVKRGQFPYQVSIRSRKTHEHFCGAAIISNFYILSAAHCLERGYNADSIYAVVGAHKLTGDGTKINILRFINNPSYDLISSRNDISLLRTKQEIVFNNFVQPIALPMADFPFDMPQSEMKAVITGWGFLKETSTSDTNQKQYQPKVLQLHKTKTISLDKCIEQMGKLNTEDPEEISLDSSIICTANEPGTGACVGDSGGPLASNDTLIGIMSWSIGCARNFPDIHTNVYRQLKWINKEIKLIEKVYPTNK